MDGHDAVQLTLAVAAAHSVCRLLAPHTVPPMNNTLPTADRTSRPARRQTTQRNDLGGSTPHPQRSCRGLQKATPPLPEQAVGSVKADVEEIKERTHR